MTLLSSLWLAAAFTGCQTAGYYGQAIQGQYQVLKLRRPISELIADPETPASLKEKFQLILKLREFAETQLDLPANGHYQTYADVHRRYVVWNVHAAPEFSLQPKTWWYPVVGKLKYRGYFSEQGAEHYAEELARNGFDTYVEGVEAYSTLGWFKDPVLNTFIHHGEAELADIIFHELAHQRCFIHGDTDFNEAFATAVAQEGVRRWLLASGDPATHEKYQVALQRTEQFVRLIQTARRQLESLYEDEQSAPSVSVKREQKEIVIDRLRSNYDQLKAQWGGFRGYDDWFAQPLNNAHLNTVATYYDLVPAFQHLLQRNLGDLKRFYCEVRVMGKLPKPERRQRLLARKGVSPAQSHIVSSLRMAQAVGGVTNRSYVQVTGDPTPRHSRLTKNPQCYLDILFIPLN